MKKKNLLFVIPSLSAGGGEKSLVNLLSQIDFNLFNVDLFLFKHEGIFMELLPKQVNILPLPDSYRIFVMPLFHSLRGFFKNGNLSLLYHRVIYTIKNRIIKGVSKKEQYTWLHIAKSLEVISYKYDVAIGFLEKTSTYFCIDKVNAQNKIGWIHIDYDKLGMDPKFDLNYFEKLDKIVTVSEECSEILKNKFPSQINKVEVIYNILSPTIINHLASIDTGNIFSKEKDEIILLTIGRLHYQKGLELAIESCNKLIKKGYKIKWYVIGEGEERKKLTALIKSSNLEDKFVLLGLKSNPYPYIKQADIYVQTSRFEGKSIALDEAKILMKPIVVTNFSTAKDQIINNYNGLIVDMNPDDISKGIEKIINEPNLKKELINNLSKINLGTENEINKVYHLLGGTISEEKYTVYNQ